MNKFHAKQLNYHDDINRNADEQATQKARVGSENWQILQNFIFTVDKASVRFERSMSAFFQLLLWIAALFGVIRLIGKRLQ